MRMVCGEITKGQPAKRAIAVAADMGSEADIVRLFEEADRAFGPVTGLVNNAAINTPALRAIEDYTFKETMEILAVNAAGIGGDMAELAHADQDVFDDVMRVNARGVWLSMRHEIPAMLEAGGGAIVNIASVYALAGKSAHHAYVASKHAVLGLTRSVALEHAARGIRVNALCAGVTGILEVGWLGTITTGLGQGMELSVIAAAVIGGANLSGGIGTAFGGVVGAALIEVIRNSLTLLGISTFWQGTFVGSFIVIAVLFDRLRSRRANE